MDVALTNFVAHSRPSTPTIVVGVLVRTFGWTLVWLALWLLTPMLLTSWEPLVINSGSMGPLIRPGDVVFIDPGRSGHAQVGDVVTFPHPSYPDRLVTHRVHSQLDDGRLVTKGDANAGPDSTPVNASDVRGVGRLVVPMVGAPAFWLEQSGASFTTTTTNATNSWSADAVDAVTGLGATERCLLGINAVDLSWTAAQSGLATGYEIGRATSSGGPYTTVATLADPTATSYTDDSVSGSTTYFYRVRTTTSSSWTADSAEVSVTTRSALLCL